MILLPYYFLDNSHSPQTLFKLHLRTEQQAQHSTIYKKYFGQAKIKDLVNDFKRRASHALFFIPIKKVMVSYPGQHKVHQEPWAVEKSTDNLPGFSGDLTILHPSLSLPPNQWSVLFKTIPLSDIPPDFHECLSTHKIQTVSIGIAGSLDKQPPHYQHRPFFGVPLLDTISLPIHLHCTFILSEDRRSVRCEKGSGNPESSFNEWLLTQKIPLLYLQLLAGWNHAHPMKECPWWPRKVGTDTISQVVFKAMETTLSTSGELVCDTHSGHRIAPSKAHFLQPLCPTGLLLALLPEDLAIIPPIFSHLSSPPLQNVGNNYLTTILRNEADSIISMYKEGRITVDDVVDVTKFLKLSSLLDSIGLPLLPLADGTLATLSTGHTTFYLPQQEHGKPQPLFPLHHFLDPKAAKEHAIYDPLEVHKLDSAAISRLVMEKIPKKDTLISSPDLERWFEELWNLLSVTPTVGIEDSVFQWLPLIPIYSANEPTRISLQRLAESDVLFIGPQMNVPLDACAALGMKLVKAKDCKRKLREAIESRKDLRKGIHRTIIGFFKELPLHRIPLIFQRLNYKLRSEFSQWFRGQLSVHYNSLPDDEKETVQHLPLWEAVPVSGLEPAKFVSIDTALVIPRGVNKEVVRRWTTASTSYVPADHLLSLVKNPVTLPTFYTDHLSFPAVMTTITPAYKSLLKEVLGSRPQPPIFVPNANGRMSPSNELYLSSNATFVAAFTPQNKAFLHPDLREFEPELCNWGLIRTVTPPSFEACALAIKRDIHKAGILPRALTVFRAYKTEMPNSLLGNRDSQNALRNIRFIPRRTGSTRYGSIPTDRYHSLPDIVSPCEILDPVYARVAWTQRAVCLDEPSPSLLLINKSVWEPEVSEVVRDIFIHSAIHLTPF